MEELSLIVLVSRSKDLGPKLGVEWTLGLGCLVTFLSSPSVWGWKATPGLVQPSLARVFALNLTGIQQIFIEHVLWAEHSASCWV